ncbi:MAG: LysM peptidoglycan-binding domain-containing M23 family metallopeptidase, partial [Patescibacteria group bacterium]
RRGTPLREGHVLVILPVSGVRHTVKKGDTVASIAKLYKGDASEILQYNDLSSGQVLAVGEIVIVPDGEIAAPSRSSSSSSIAVGTRVTLYPNYDGYYVRPVQGRKTQGIHGYNGVDIAAPRGNPIVAAANGVVIVSREGGWNGGYGNYIVISHNNGTQTLYSHNLRNAVSVGDIVEQGQVIGFVGTTGRSTGNHVHFEVRGAKNPF